MVIDDAHAPDRREVTLSRGDVHYAACVLDRILSLDVLGLEEPDYARQHASRHTELLTCLTNRADDHLTYDLRVLSEPDAATVSRGRITVAVLCRYDGLSAQEAFEHAGDLRNLLEALFAEYTFRLASTEEVARLLEPFAVRHLAGITRRAGPERLDTLALGAPRKDLGFRPAPASPTHSDPSLHTILHVFPFLPTGGSFATLFRLLLLESQPLAVSVRLHPTTLSAVEEAFLDEQIAHCERAARAELDRPPANLNSLRPTLREQAVAYQRHLARLLFGLKDNAGMMTIEVAAPGPLPATVADAVGALITQPAGGSTPSMDDILNRYLAGGYVTCDRSWDDAARQAFSDLSYAPITNPEVCGDAGRIVHLFDAVEAASAFRLPPSQREELPGVETQFWRLRPPPRHLPEKGCLLGQSADRSSALTIRLAPEDRRRHLYAVGQTGTGKTTLLKTMILDDLRSGEGVCVIDPHGDLFREIKGLIPEERLDDVVILDPTDDAHPVGLNMLEYKDESQRHFLVQEMVGIVTRLMEDEYGNASGFVGPIFFQHMRMNLLLAMSNPDDPGTLLEFHAIHQQKGFWKRWLPLRKPDPILQRWIDNVLAATDYLRMGSENTSMGGWISSKFEQFVFDPMLRRIFGQKRSSIDLRKIMDRGQILLVNLAKGELTEVNSRFLGMILLGKLQAAAMGRAKLSPQDRRPFTVYVDEFQSLSTQSFVTLLSEARKFGLNLVLANQFVSQIKDPRIMDAIFGNVGTLISFRVGQSDAELIERRLAPTFTRTDLVNLPNWHACIATLIAGQTVRPFTLRTVVEANTPDSTRSLAVEERSRSRYARPADEVDAEITRGLTWPPSESE